MENLRIHIPLQASLAPSGMDLDASLKRRFLDALGDWQDPPEAIREELESLLDALWASGLPVVKRAPRIELVMVTVRDSFNTPFYLGEVLVTSAEVLWKDPAAQGHVGFGMIQGDRPEAAVLLACLEAMGTAVAGDWMGPIEALLAKLEEGAEQYLRRVSKMAASTTVEFESMKKERVDFGSLGD